MIYALIITNTISFFLGFKLKDFYIVKKANKGGFAERYAAGKLIKNKRK